MKRLFIEPLDVLMFRSERPFIARESHVARLGVISPLTFEGAIKSKIFIELCERKGFSPIDFQRKKKRDESEEEFKKSLERLRKSVEDKIKKDSELKELLETLGYTPLRYSSKLNVLGVFFAEKGKEVEYFPVPNDIVREDNKKENLLKIRPILKDEFKILGTEVYTCLSSYSKIKDIDDLLKFDALIEYLMGKEPNKSWIRKKPYDLESRTGIQLEKETKKTVEGHLYMAEFLRLLEGWGFIVWYASPKEITDGIIRLGGEGKGAICRKIEKINLHEKLNFPEIVEELNEERKFKLYLASPSHFNGYKPPENMLKKELDVHNLKLIAALPGKPIYIGGYDFAINKEKPLRRWVNAGAVYYYKFEGKIKDDLPLPIKIIDKNIDMRCAFIGRW